MIKLTTKYWVSNIAYCRFSEPNKYAAATISGKIAATVFLVPEALLMALLLQRSAAKSNPREILREASRPSASKGGGKKNLENK
jgi:hypothetical protein